MFEKRAYDEIFRYREFYRADGKGWLNSETTLSGTPSAKVYKKSDDTEQASMISDVAIYSNTKVKYKIKGGTAGLRYYIVFQVTDSNGQKFEDRLEFLVK